MKKVMFISSKGGHLDELLMLKSMFDNYDYTIVTENDKISSNLKDKYNVRFLLKNNKKNFILYPIIMIINTILSLYLYLKIRPEVLISTGADTSGPMCLISKIFGSKVIFIETFANINKKTKTGKIVYKFADLFIVQWESMLKLYPKAVYMGWIY